MGHRIKKRVLKLNFEDSHYLTIQELLLKNKLVRVQLLTTDTFRSKTGMSPELMSGILQFAKRLYDIRINDALERLY